MASSRCLLPAERDALLVTTVAAMLGVHLSQGTYASCGCSDIAQVKIMKTHDPRGIDGPKVPLPDVVVVHTPKDDEFGFAAGGGKEGEKVSISCL